MILHTVLFKWMKEVTPEQIQSLSNAMEGLRPAVDVLLDLKHGADLAIRDGNADYVLSAVFADEAAWQAYQDHPAHKLLIEQFVSPILDSRTASQILIKDIAK